MYFSYINLLTHFEFTAQNFMINNAKFQILNINIEFCKLEVSTFLTHRYDIFIIN